MANSTSGINKTGLKKNVININSYMTQIAKELKELSSNINALMVGNADGPYWNGNKAMRFYKKAIGNLGNDIIDYGTARKVLVKLANKYEEAAKEDN